MTRRGLAGALAAALIALAIVPGPVSAAPIRLGNIDQDVARQDAWVTVESQQPVTQTFIAGATGRLVYVELYCAASSDHALVGIGVGAFPMATWACPTTPGWEAFPLFFDPPTVQSGAQYTMEIRAYSTVQLAASASDYAGGCFGLEGACTGDPTDIAFRTYVQPFPDVSLVWSPTSVTPGTATPVTLTLEADFPGYVHPEGIVHEDRAARITLDPLPEWFEPSAVSCSVSIPQPCPSGMFGQWDIVTTGSPFTTTITIAGTATLPAGGGSASASGCAGYAYYMYPYIDCVPARADLAAAGAAPTQPTGTPPATGTAPENGPSGEQLPWLPWALCACLGSLFVIRRRAWAR